MAGGTRRFLLCSAWTPWGPARGFQHRLRMVAEALAGLGTVDVCVLGSWRSPELELVWPDWVGDAEWCAVGDASRWSRSPVRQAVLTPRARRAAVARFFSKSYDLTWCAEPRGYEPVAGLLTRPVVLDLHNVVSSSVAYKRDLLVRRPWLAAAWRSAIDDPEYQPGIVRRWQQWEARAVGACDRVVVCSDLDRGRVGGRASVIPNCYPRPPTPAGRQHDPAAPLRIGFVGLIDYQPNFDAVRWFATEVLPRVRRSVPDAVFHVMGHAGPEVARLGRYEGVRFLGYVPDLAPELAELSMLVAPIRFGGGTRFKILEGFAHEIPVVSTTVGAEGLDARDGEHLLVRDDPDAFARAVVELHQEAERRHRLIANGAALYEARYTWDRGVAAVQDEVASLAAATVRP